MPTRIAFSALTAFALLAFPASIRVQADDDDSDRFEDIELELRAGARDESEDHDDDHGIEIKVEVGASDEVAEAWENWAEKHARNWEKWAERHSRDWEAWAEEHEKVWEEWAKRHEAQWSEFEVEADEMDADQIREVVRRSLGTLSDMPMKELYDGLLENIRDLEDAPWEDLAEIEGLIRETVEHSLKGLEKWCPSASCWPRCGVSRTEAARRRWTSIFRGFARSSASLPLRAATSRPSSASV